MDMKTAEKKDIMAMKLLHYFITEKNYNPVVLHGVQNEIWLENMQENYKIVRIVSNYIHNDEQLNFDLFKTKKITGSIKRKTFNLTMNVLSIFVDLGEAVNLPDDEKRLTCVDLTNDKDFKKYEFVDEYYPGINDKLKFPEKGLPLFMRITDDINQKNIEEAKKVDDIFTPKKPIITYIIIAINLLIFLYGFLLNKSDFLIQEFSTYGPLIRNGEIYRIITGGFVHIDIIHFACNMYSLYILGTQAESFFGKTKYTLIYFFSLITGSLLSIIFNINTPSIGASGAIFGVLGAMLYFGLNYRVYLGNNFLKQILPVILINLAIGFVMPNIDNFAHIGGLVGGFFLTMALGIKHRVKKYNIINGLLLSLIYFGFLIFMNFFYIK